MLNDMLSYFDSHFPLIKVFRTGQTLVVYDAKAHFAFSATETQLNIIHLLLRGISEATIGGSSNTDEATVQSISETLRVMRGCGLFLPGPLNSIAPEAPNTLSDMLHYYEGNIFPRKFTLEVTEACNFRCRYCPITLAQDGRRHSTRSMPWSVAEKAIDYFVARYTRLYSGLPTQTARELLLRRSPPTLSWYGGEPFLNFPLIRSSAPYFARRLDSEVGIPPSRIHFSVSTNLSLLTEEIVDFLVANNVFLYVSMDGPKDQHDLNRVFADGTGTFDHVYRNLLLVKARAPRYYSERVAILSVVAGNHNVDTCDQFLWHPDSLHRGCMATWAIPASYRRSIVNNPATLLPEFSASMPIECEAFRGRIASMTPVAFDGAIQADHTFMETVESLNDCFGIRLDEPRGVDDLNITMTCPMGFDNLMVGVDGVLHMCHKTDGTLPIGDCDNGIDFATLLAYYARFHRLLNSNSCKRCWRIRFCKLCAAFRSCSGSFFNPSDDECECLRLVTEKAIRMYLNLMEHDQLYQHRKMQLAGQVLGRTVLHRRALLHHAVAEESNGRNAELAARVGMEK